ncbi:hypothetical protein TSTA_096470 [Talaromyces stipitatus ATCC 10500]|uniref:Uncharacterized protein n=1 Tax=Talaromyces stipitatus (strain ATCC 10500 / CBS 375.48 / QM 6759 / NRRL 1006) TaxID=441959 RepID=B8M3M6_TALSN|nr:uncharacterized protein TSTA_096470 [Talaromyces stipitatus ATCC 10500]EED22398.1 hypothetical protein TSTA_096470 [Talaromyces stipitatus ATCC 10500]
MTSEDWTKEEGEDKDDISSVTEGPSETASTVPESEGGVPLPVPSIFSATSMSRRQLTPMDHEKLAGGAWLEQEDAKSTAPPSEAESAAVTRAASMAAKYSGWNENAVEAEKKMAPPALTRAVPAKGSEPERRIKGWAKITSADPERSARILKMSDPTRFDKTKEDETENPSGRTIIGAKDRSRLHKQIRTGGAESASPTI